VESTNAAVSATWVSVSPADTYQTNLYSVLVEKLKWNHLYHVELTNKLVEDLVKKSYLVVTNVL
jgi:hypothetical protein